MEKKDILILALLVALMIAWPTIDRHVIKPLFFASRGEPAGEPGLPSRAAEATAGGEPAAITQPIEPEQVTGEEERGAELEAEAETAAPEQQVTLDNDRMTVVVSSHGAAVVSATLKDYRASLDPASGPVTLDFQPARALLYEGLAGFSGSSAFEVVEHDSGRVVLERTSAAGLRLRRRIELSERYRLQITDELTNTATEPVNVGDALLWLGVMRNLEARPQMRGVIYLGVDTLSPGEGVRYLARKIPGFFEQDVEKRGLPRLPQRIRVQPHENPVDWVAAKNKYFVQILRPDEGGESCEIYAARELTPQEQADPEYRPKMTPLAEVSCAVRFRGRALEPRESMVRLMHYYVGPKKYDDLAALGFHQAGVMELGMWPWLKVAVLKTMNGIHRVIPNYGVAIILLTIIVRVIFWPVTHKSTESMKRMAEIQPLVNELRTKYKDNPQKQQQEIMALYKEHKVNPLGGCLPMLVQIPVFIALFVVLRSAIELRFASFLWVRDLSEPENLLAGKIPLVGSLNILPIIMAVTMYWQQKLTPSAGDPQQQKMMAFMPLMMLVFFYHFASGLALYWTTNQCLMIAQQLVQRKKQARARAG